MLHCFLHCYNFSNQGIILHVSSSIGGRTGDEENSMCRFEADYVDKAGKVNILCAVMLVV